MSSPLDAARKALEKITDNNLLPLERQGDESLDVAGTKILYGAWSDCLANAREALAALSEAEAAIRAEERERCAKAIVHVRYGPPSSWPEEGHPDGWPFHHPCTPQDAANHDNGCNDAFAAIRRLSPQPTEAPE